MGVPAPRLIARVRAYLPSAGDAKMARMTLDTLGLGQEIAAGMSGQLEGFGKACAALLEKSVAKDDGLRELEKVWRACEGLVGSCVCLRFPLRGRHGS